MNPLKWIRWKVLVALVVIGGVFYFLGLDPLAHWRINDLGHAKERARWQVGDLDLGLLAGDLSLEDLLVATARAARAASEAAAGPTDGDGDGEDKVFAARLTSFELSTTELLRKRMVVDRVEVTAPSLRLERRPDGSTNIGDLAEDEAEPGAEAPEPEAEGEPRDWVETVKVWYERLQKVREKLSGKGEGDAEAGAEGEEGAPDHYAKRATYPFAVRPGMVIHEVLANDLEIDFEEAPGATAGGPSSLATLRNGKISIKGLSSAPTVHDDPISLSLTGDLDGASVALETSVDLRGDSAKYGVEIDVSDLSASLVEAFVGRSLPVSISQGNVAVRARVSLDGEENLLVEPVLAFRDVRLEKKPETSQVAGLDAGRFVAAFNEASAQLGGEPLEIADLRIEGTLSQPRFVWGDTVKNLVLEGGRAFARAQLRKAQDAAGQAFDEGSEKVREALGEEAGRLRERLGDSDAAKDVEDSLGDVLPGDDAAKKVEDAAKGFGRGLFGGFGASGEDDAGESSSGNDDGGGEGDGGEEEKS